MISPGLPDRPEPAESTGAAAEREPPAGRDRENPFQRGCCPGGNAGQVRRQAIHGHEFFVGLAGELVVENAFESSARAGYLLIEVGQQGIAPLHWFPLIPCVGCPLGVWSRPVTSCGRKMRTKYKKISRGKLSRSVSGFPTNQELTAWPRSRSLVMRICRQRLTHGLGRIGSKSNFRVANHSSRIDRR